MIVTDTNPDISYRVIDKAELPFAGSKKTPFDFSLAVLDKPTEIPVLSLAESLRNYKRMRASKNELAFYSFPDKKETLAYNLSPELDFVVEALIDRGGSTELVEMIIEWTYLCVNAASHGTTAALTSNRFSCQTESLFRNVLPKFNEVIVLAAHG